MWPATVLPLARIGTVVSSPCRRSAARTCASIRRYSGMVANTPAPTWSASVETLSSMPSRLKRSLCRFKGRCWPNLSNRIVARSVGPMKPRGVAWNGAGGCAIVWQARHENFSRTVSISFHRRGIISKVSVTSSPSFDKLADPQHGQPVGAARTIRSRSIFSGKGLRTGRRRVNDRTVCVGLAAASAASSFSVADASSSSSCSSSWSSSHSLRSARWP